MTGGTASRAPGFAERLLAGLTARGIELADDRFAELLARSVSELELRVGRDLAASLGDQQVESLLALLESGDDRARLEALDRYVPAHRRIVATVSAQLVDEIVDWCSHRQLATASL